MEQFIATTTEAQRDHAAAVQDRLSGALARTGRDIVTVDALDPRETDDAAPLLAMRYGSGGGLIATATGTEEQLAGWLTTWTGRAR